MGTTLVTCRRQAMDIINLGEMFLPDDVSDEEWLDKELQAWPWPRPTSCGAIEHY